uniref:Actin-associated protein FAM107A n=1 Tax=Hippocampus comes TaxID=109280 RepID=A0A3Q2Y175_HIPCM
MCSILAPAFLCFRPSFDLIKPRKLLNPVKSSRSHQELHRELMTSCKRYRQTHHRGHIVLPWVDFQRR